MNPNLKHLLLDLGGVTPLIAAGITAQPQFHNSPWLPAVLGVLGVISFVYKSLTVGDVPPSTPVVAPAVPAAPVIPNPAKLPPNPFLP